MFVIQKSDIIKIVESLQTNNKDKNRVIQQTNSLQADSLPLVKGEGQQPEKYYYLRSNDHSNIFPVVEISCTIRNKALDINTCALS